MVPLFCARPAPYLHCGDPFMNLTALVIEDEPAAAELLGYNLRKGGFSVEFATDGFRALDIARNLVPDIIVLDLMLPGMDGYALCEKLKADPLTCRSPILILSARTSAQERIRGLESGADDYVTKPFSPREVVLRIQAMLRRLRANPRVSHEQVDEFRIDRDALEIHIQNRALNLTTTEFKLLTLLIERRNRVQSREALLRDVWGYENFIDTRTVDTHIGRLRDKLGEQAQRIETIRGEGFCFR
jgi:DNA-binding response OmpR family regulator